MHYLNCSLKLQSLFDIIMKIVFVVLQIFAIAYTLKKVQLESFSKSKLTYGDQQYIIDSPSYSGPFVGLKTIEKIRIGTPGQEFKVILDTGSYIPLVFLSNCSNCPKEIKKFNSEKSSTFLITEEHRQIEFGTGIVEGRFGMENLQFDGINVQIPMLFVSNSIDIVQQGIMGLGQSLFSANIFEQAYKNGQLASSTFAFEIGKTLLKQKSFFYYNVSKNDFPNATYINVNLLTGWLISVDHGLYFGKTKYQVNSVLIDTGSAIMSFNVQLYQTLDNQLFSKVCSPRQNEKPLRQCSCHSDLYKNFTFTSQGHLLTLTPEIYIIGYGSSRNCKLGISMLNFPDTIVLGNRFLENYITIFDQSNFKIGFVENFKKLDYYISSVFLLYIFDLLAVLTLIGFCMIICIDRNKIGFTVKSPSKNQSWFQLGSSK